MLDWAVRSVISGFRMDVTELGAVISTVASGCVGMGL